MRDYPAFIVPHSDHGDVECCGLVMIDVRGDKADLQCNECGVILKTVSGAEAEQVLGEMEAAQPSCAERCPYCGHKNTFTGFTEMKVYTCRRCGRGVDVEERAPAGAGRACAGGPLSLSGDHPDVDGDRRLTVDINRGGLRSKGLRTEEPIRPPPRTRHAYDI
jgi:DNA-directed RNA polymerase subunit RPC12/RpoP